MSFTDFFIRRPAFTIVCMIMMTLFGCIHYFSLNVRWIPSVHPPVVSIYAGFPGASSGLVEAQVTTPIEASLSGIDGVESITSNSREGESTITLNFKLERNIDQAVEDVRSALARVTGALPRDVSAPLVSKANTDDMPGLFLAFADSSRSAKELSDYVDQLVIPRFQTVEGVANVMTFGRHASAMRIWLDPLKMAASHVTVEDVNDALASQNVQVPSGQIHSTNRSYNVVTNETLTNAEQFNDLIIRKDTTQTVRLKNVGKAVIAPVDEHSAFRVNGQSAMALGIIPQSTANPLDVSKRVLHVFEQTKKVLPKTMQATVVYNQATFIQASVSSVYDALLEAVLFVLLVILAFLASWRATLIPLITIPVCLISTFTLLHYFNFSINTITLMAFVLAIGLVVDDAIVMVENITRHIEDGMNPYAAALKGAREMVFPIIAMSLTLAAVYTPIAFTAGILNSVFREFALTLAGAVIISGVVALTLSPMMCAQLLVKKQEGYYANGLACFFNKLQNTYKKSLSFLMLKRKLVLLTLSFIGLAGLGLFYVLPSELSPTEDRNELYVFLSAPHDASFEYTDAYVKKLESLYKTIPELTSYLAQVGDGSASSSYQVLNLKPKNQRQRSAQEIADDITDQTKQIPGVKISAFVPPSPLTWFSGGEGNNVGLAVMSVGEYRDLYAVMKAFVSQVKKSPAFVFADSHLKWDKNQFEISIDREKIADLNISMQTITNSISTLLAGRTVGKFEYGGKQYDIMVQMNQNKLALPDLMSQFYVRNNANTMISLADVVTINETSNPGGLPHNDRLRSDNLFASLAPGYTIADAVTILQGLAKQYLPDNMKISFLGEAQTYLESSHKMLITFLLAVIFIYLVLVAQFESFVDPLVILVTVPFALIGALIALKLSGSTLNIYSNIGLVTLIGLIAKHGILITEFANQSLSMGKSISNAVIDAAVLRLRPILMTTAAMVLGALPLAFAYGPGSETRQQIGWVIVGGMLIGTFFSLIIIPIVYSYLAKFKRVNRFIAPLKATQVSDLIY
jgi:multidrug efflux pump